MYEYGECVMITANSAWSWRVQPVASQLSVSPHGGSVQQGFVGWRFCKRDDCRICRTKSQR